MVANINEKTNPNYIFEVSWEICNKVGGIHTVVSTKALTLSKDFEENLIMIGPDVWRENDNNPEFIENKNLFKSWRQQAATEGLKLKVGYWNITGKPFVILVEFTDFISKKDDIFKRFWESYKLDSLSGQWDYIEPCLFGYAAGKVIESFCRFHLTQRDKVIAQFHEWMTGAGVLYLKKAYPRIATVFTTHATVMGRSIAGNGLPLYSKLSEYDGDAMAREFGVASKQSLEKISAVNADAFTTVSEITAKECAQFLGKTPDVVTPNGFEDSFVPLGEEFKLKRREARNKLLSISRAMFNKNFTDDTFLIATSGRYEFKNKGIDLFIDAIGKLKNEHDGKLNKDVLAFILVPAANYGPKKELLKKINEETTELSSCVLTHDIHYSEYDPVLQKIEENGLYNCEGGKINIVFVPSYLNGSDGVFNMNYYDLLIGFDLTVFPSYYEPWGYTPLESLAFHVPTITTTLAGFGLWVQTEYQHTPMGIAVVSMTDTNREKVIDDITGKMIECINKTSEHEIVIREKAYDISRIALWNNLIKYYKKAYSVALSKVEERASEFIIETKTEKVIHVIKPSMANEPNWRRILVQSNLHEDLKGLQVLAKNLWWCWNYRAQELFEYIDENIWKKSGHNPLILLEQVSYERLEELTNDRKFLRMLADVTDEFEKYMEKAAEAKHPKIAYFSMEYGFHDTVKTFSGGLGILAGDYLKEASDSNFAMAGIGLLYRYGYFTQGLSVKGEQLAYYEPQRFTHMPIEPVRDEKGDQLSISIAFPGRMLHARIWRVHVGRVPLYLMDTDYEENEEQDRTITHQLYGGDWENRFKQEMLLGIGGIRLINILGLKPDIYHCNEGHAAFIGLERLRNFIAYQNLSFAESLEIVRASTLFTTHTPVPAGHDSFSEDLMRTYISHYPERLKIGWDELMDLGRMEPGNKDEKFSMSCLAVNMSQEVNGVSKLHGRVSQKMFNKMWRGYYPEELFLGYVTNGVHYETWTAKAWQELYDDVLDRGFAKYMSDKEYWSKIYNVSNTAIWRIRQSQRKIMIDYIRERLELNWTKRLENPRDIIEITKNLNEDVLTIGFARRFATYKRAHLLFRDKDRLLKLLSNPERPVQILIAGKAHPHDKAGQDLIKYIVEISKTPEFIGKLVFLENYDIELAKQLVQGVDIWLNTPTRPLEASGTSGMKAVLNGALHFSVLDGWWVEGYRENAGWALKLERTYENQDYQNDLDAETIYSLIENEITPAFYERNDRDVPERWISFIKKSIAEIAPQFVTKRMIDDYSEKFYTKLYDRTLKMMDNDFEMAKKLSAWKKKMSRSWDSIEVVSFNLLEPGKKPIKLGDHYPVEVVIDLNNVSEDDIGVELVISDFINEKDIQIVKKLELDLVKMEGRRATYTVDFFPKKSGALSYGIRIFPKNADLPHRQDFAYAKWI